ncbi:hypothetical protein GCM10009120_07750 [Sphingobacterium siyangense subsp. cladoniae]|uniref:helix-turn-helix transcriptional regulator n=1 Tax=Sphingobacterium siyangense TaxID=459529 RepID=UPI0031F8C900
MEEVFEIIILELDYYLMERIRELRIKHVPYLSQLMLSQELGLPDSYVSRAENLKVRLRYNVRILNKAAHYFKVPYADLFPKVLLSRDLVRMKVSKIPHNKRILKPGPDGEVLKAYRILSVTPLSLEETDLWQANKLPYLRIIK